jgi:hypothetical protein
MLEPAIAPPFPLSWGFTTRQDPPALQPPARLIQVHGCDVVAAGERVQRADGLWTRTPGLTIGTRVADCVPVLLAGPVLGQPWVAALHAGWRGTVAGILRRAVALYRDQGGRPGDLVWALGPAIRACHFEVGDEVVEAARRDPAWRDELVRPGPRGRAHLDLPGLLQAQALDLGLDPALDGSLPLCTYCDPEQFYSYRRGDRHLHQWCWIRIGPLKGY